MASALLFWCSPPRDLVVFVLGIDLLETFFRDFSFVQTWFYLWARYCFLTQGHHSIAAWRRNFQTQGMMDCWRVPAHRTTCQESEVWNAHLWKQALAGVFFILHSLFRALSLGSCCSSGWVIAVVFLSSALRWFSLKDSSSCCHPHCWQILLIFGCLMDENYFPYDNNWKGLNCR